MILGFFLSFLIPLTALAANGPSCVQRTSQARDLASLSQHSCEETKRSPQCQQLYKMIQEDGGDLQSKALNCEKQANSSWLQAARDRASGCLIGGVLEPTQDFVNLIANIPGKIASQMKEDRNRLQECDRNPQQKENIFKLYNQSVPKLLQVQTPPASTLKSLNCARLEMIFNELKKNREQYILSRVDGKQFSKNAKLTEDEKAYFAWRADKEKTFAGANNDSLWKIASEKAKEFKLRLECYNPEAAWALKCEILYITATTVAGGAGALKNVAKLSGLKATRLAAAGEKAVVRTSVNLEKEVSSLRNLSREERIAKAEKEIGSLSETEKVEKLKAELNLSETDPQYQSKLAALQKSHNEGAEAGETYGTYSQATLKRKMRALTDGGWTQDEAEYLVLRGYAGNAKTSFTPKVQVKMSNPNAQAEVDSAFKTGDSAQHYRVAAEKAGKYSGYQEGVAQSTEARALYESSAKKLEVELKNSSNSLSPSLVKQKIGGIEEYIIDPTKEIPEYRMNQWKQYESTIESTQRKYEEAATQYIRAGKKEEAMKVLNQSPVVSNFNNGVAKQNYINRYLKETQVTRRPSAQ